MVGLSDIPIVGKALDMISEATVLATYRGFRYMFRYKDLVSVLNSEIKNVGIQEERVSEKVDQEKDNGKTIEEDVLTWQKKVKQIQDNAKEFMERYEKRASWGCIKPLPIPNPLSRFRLGREAAKKTKMIADLTMEGNKYMPTYEIARNPPHKNLPNVVGDFQDFQSRKEAYNNIWQLLITEGSPQIHGIYGLPGVGKTRIADQIWKEAKENGIFNKVIKAVVSGEEDLDIIRLQKELAGDLNCRLESQDDIKHRASQLKQSIINGDKVLVILDDVWKKIPSHDIGIPSSKGCKILFTSREKKVCLDNDCVDPVEIRALTDDEAWDMFENSVDAGKIESLEDKDLAKQVCKKCAGLPLLLCAVGKALRNMSGNNVWNDALDQFQNCKIERIPGIDQQVYACLKVSYDNLVHDAKTCLLLCSLYPEDANISTSMLIELGIGSKLLPDGRSRVLSMVDILKSSSLVVGNKYNEKFKLHDVIRAVARSIAVNDHSFLFASSDSSFPQNNASPSLLCLEVKKKNFYFPSDMVYDRIYTFWIESTSVQKDTFQVWEVAAMARNLGCLILRNIEWVHQIPVQQLGKLRSLVLQECDIRKMDFSFISEHLETLCIWNCALPRPLNIKNLKYLRKLEILGDVEQVVLVDNTISSLSSLEELHIPFGYRYQVEVVDGQVDSISQLMDIGKLTCLKSLKMTFRASEWIQDPNLFTILSEFDISVGRGRGFYSYSNSNSSSTRLIYLSYIQIEAAAFQSLIERAEEVRLFLVDVDVSSIFSSNREAFSDLKVLYIVNSDTMEHLARISHPHQIQPQTSFSKLTTLDIKYFSAMKYLFCNSVAKCLVQLKQLCIQDCPVMEAIIMNEGSSRIDGQEDIINFSKLESLKLSGMPKLKGFNIERKDMYSTSTISLIDNSAAIPTLSLFSGEVAFPALEALELEELTLSDIWGKHYYNDNASSFCKLKSLKVFSCTKLETVIPLAMLHKLQNLEYLEIKNCSSMVSEVGTYGSNTVVCPLVALTYMHLEKLPCLTNTWLNSMDHSPAITLYPNLKKLEILECNSLNNVFLPSIAGDLKLVKILHLDSCKMMTEIIGAAAGDNISKDVFSNLVTCYIMYCDKINLEDIELWRDDFACQLKSLHLKYDEEIQLPQLQIYNPEELTLGNCWWHHEQIFPCFSRLRRLEVTKSGRSTLFPFSVISSLQQLEVIKISECALLENIMEDVRGNGASSMDKKIIEFIQLRRVFLKDLPKLGSFMSGANYECHMPALKIVHIDNCGFSTLFMCCRYLQLLAALQVRNCRLLEYIVEDIRDDEISMTNDKIITFSLYWQLYLVNLPNLKSFSRTSSYAFNMPNLKGLELHQCPQFENFSSLKTSPGRSIRVYSDWHRGWKDISDLNDYIKQNRKGGSNLISDSAGETDKL